MVVVELLCSSAKQYDATKLFDCSQDMGGRVNKDVVGG